MRLGKRIRTEVAEWEEPRHSGPVTLATVPHFAPLCNTIPHRVRPMHDYRLPQRPLFRSAEPFQAGGARWDAPASGRPFACTAHTRAQSCMRAAAMREILRRAYTPVIALAPESSNADTSAAATSKSTDGTSMSATTSWILGAARAASSRTRR